VMKITFVLHRTPLWLADYAIRTGDNAQEVVDVTVDAVNLGPVRRAKLLDVQMTEGEVDPMRRHGVRIPEWLRRVSAPDYVRYLTSHGAKQGVILNGRIEL